MDVIMYVVEEVSRQGHDVQVLEGIQRVEWMLRAWTFAMEENRPRPALSDAILIGQLVEPQKNRGGLRTRNIRVGSRICPDAGDVPRLLRQLFDNYDNFTPVEFYKEFEFIHPFVDGNGRSGKVLLNWAHGTLLKPFFPPDDLFGEPIINP